MSQPTAVVSQSGFAVVAGNAMTIYDKDGHSRSPAIGIAPEAQVVAVADHFAVTTVVAGQVGVIFYDQNGRRMGRIT
jgi:hypothetical protein